MSCQSLLACSFSAEKSADNLVGIPLSVIGCFSLTAFNICSLYLIFISVINMCLSVCFLEFFLYETLSFLVLIHYFLSQVREVFDYNLFRYFPRLFLLLFFFWDHCNLNVGGLMLSQRSLRLSLFLLIHFFFFLPFFVKSS